MNKEYQHALKSLRGVFKLSGHANALESKIKALQTQVKELEAKLTSSEKCLEAKDEALKHFVDKVEHGKAKSIETYALQKRVLALKPEDFLAENHD
jgi:predicted RNase H-like nuclease (RuvC/YqgF family)